jgi:hypothetical protein
MCHTNRSVQRLLADVSFCQNAEDLKTFIAPIFAQRHEALVRVFPCWFRRRGQCSEQRGERPSIVDARFHLPSELI